MGASFEMELSTYDLEINRFNKILRCPICQTSIEVHGNGPCCASGPQYICHGNILSNSRLSESSSSERGVRDQQAAGYLEHAKFPTQIASVRRWLSSQSAVTQTDSDRDSAKVALDLGCGPGPYTRLLQEHGFSVLAMDFSLESLRINAEHSLRDPPALYVQENLNNVLFHDHCVDAVILADVLQHLGSRHHRKQWLHRSLKALRPGGTFYLSFFQLNIKNFFRGDVHGAFAGGKIEYERLTVPNVCSDLPPDVVVERTFPMNIFHSDFADSVARRIPLARFLARMAVVTGRRL